MEGILKHLATILISIVFTGSILCQDNLTTIKDHFEKGEYASAKSLGEVLFASDSTQYELMDLLSKIYETEQHLPKAIKYNSLKFRVDSSSITARKIGKLYVDAGNISSAIPFYNYAHHKNEKDILAIKGLAECYFALEVLNFAQDYINKGLALDESNISLQLLNARIAYKSKDYPMVVNSLKKVQNERDLDNFFLRVIGFSYIQLDSADQAIIYLNRSLKTDNGIEYAYYYLALAYEQKQEPQSAIHYYQEAIKSGLSIQLGLYYRRVAANLMKQEKWKDAITQLKQSLQYEDLPASYFSLAQCYDKTTIDKKQVIKHYESFLKKANNQDQTYIKFAESRVKELKEYVHMK